LTDSGEIVLEAPCRQRRFAVEGLTHLRPAWISPGRPVLRHKKGKVVLLPELDGLHVLVAELKRMNPSIILKGG